MLGHMRGQLLGQVIVVTGDDDALVDVASTAMDQGASVAVVSRALAGDVPATVRFRADPGDRSAWERIAMHVEQHLGPVDGVVTDSVHRAVVDAVFAGDLARRGHGAVVTADGSSTADLLTRLGCTPAAARARPAGVDPDR